MSYQVLARKWRPRTFAELVGQEHVVRALSNALDNDRLHHAYLFTGTRGVGKTTLARIFAKSLNCEQGVGSVPCGQCSACREIDEGRFVDLLEVDAASRTKVDQTRELLDNVPYAPVRGRYKVYLIDEVHMFSGGSFNALLKTLEEPPPHVKFLLATTDPQKVPLTVLSRCLQFNLKRLPYELIRDYLREILEKEGVANEIPALGLLARGADGSMRDALSLMDQAIAFGGGTVMETDVRTMLGTIAQDSVYDLLQVLAGGESAAVLTQISRMAELTPDYAGVLRDLLSLLHRVALVQAVPDALDDSAGEVEPVTRLAGELAPADVQLYYQIGLIGQRDLPLAPDPRAGFEMVLLRMLAFRPDSTAMNSPSPTAARRRESTTGSGKSGPSTPATSAKPPASEAKAKRSDEVVKDAEAEIPVDLSQWHQVVESLAIGGIARQLANNCIYDNWDGRVLKLRLDPSHKHMQVGTSEQRLCKALELVLGRPIKLDIRAEDVSNAATPAQLQAKTRDERQQEAEKAMAGDALVKGMQKQFGAQLVPGSVRPADE